MTNDTTAAAWSVRRYRDTDEAAVIELFREMYPRWPARAIDVTPEEHLRWKLHSNPEAFAFQTVAECDGRVVGTRFVVGMYAKVGDEEALICQGMDNAVLALYQDQGMLTAMRGLRWDEFNQTFDLIVTDTGAHPAVRQINRHAGIRPLANEIDVLSRGLGASPSGATLSIATVATPDGRFDAFWREVSAPYAFIARRDSAYLAWRYADRRAGPFVLRVIEDDTRLLGYAALRTSERRGFVADVLALPGRLDVVRELIGDAIRSFAAQDVDTVECCLPRHHPYRSVVEELGFALRRTLPIGYRPMRAAPESLAFLQDEHSAIHLSYGDFDLV